MKVLELIRVVLLASFGLLFSIGANAQPTSVAGIFPGKTTVKELRTLVSDPGSIDGGDYHMVHLKGLDKESATVRTRKGVVYKVEVDLTFKVEMMVALIDKYGKPIRKTGEIRKVACQNGFGAKFERLDGSTTEFWAEKDGVQATLESRAANCATRPSMYYAVFDKKISDELATERILDEAKKYGNKMEVIKKGI